MAPEGATQRERYIFVTPWPVRAGSGVNNVVLGLQHSAEKDYRTDIAVTGWTQPPPEQAWIKLVPPGGSFRNFLSFAVRFVPSCLQLLRLTRGAAAVNPHYFGIEILPLAVLRKLRLTRKLILSIHGADVTAAHQLTGWQKRLYCWIGLTADLVVGCSHALVTDFKQICPGARTAAVWNGIVAPLSIDPVSPFDFPYLVSVAAFVEKKGHDVLIEAFRFIREQRPDLHLLLIGGDGPRRQTLADRIAELGLSEYVHWKIDLLHEQVWTFVRLAECFVLASREEPFGIALLEAGSIGTPVVATAVGGVPEFLKDGVHGLTCPPDEPACLAAAVLSTLSDKQATARRVQAFRAQASSFTWDRAWREYKSKAGPA